MSLPTSWAELYDRLAYALGNDRASAEEWVRQALTATWGVSEVTDLPRFRRQIAFQKMSGVVLDVEGKGEIAFAIDQRTIVSASFARYFRGAVLDGPPWRVSAYEQRPTHAAYLDALSDF